MTNNIANKCWFVVLVVTLTLLSGGSRAEPPTEQPGASKKESNAPLDQLVKDREKLDHTVWAKEKLAHRYEATITQMWDSLIAQRKDPQGDKFAVLKKIPFSKITLGESGPVKQYDHAIRATTFGGKGSAMTHPQWASLLDNFKQQGYRIEQTDWHHAEFTPAEKKPASSKFTFAIHATNKRLDLRIILRGAILVIWSKKNDSRGNPIPQEVDARDIQILTRKGPPAFEEVLTVNPSTKEQPSGVQPLLVHDLDGDGLSEIVLAGCNLRYNNLGKFKFKKDDFLWWPTQFFELGVLADFTGDGAADFVTVDTGSRNVLIFKGNKKGLFLSRPKGRQKGESPLVQPQVMTAGDIDNDGDLDLWVAQYKISYLQGQMPSPYYDANDGFPAFLLRNDGNGKFQDITKEAGLAKKSFRRTYGSSFVDLDDDGDLDLLVVSDFSGIDVHYNDGHGKFTDVTKKVVDQRHSFGMSVTFGDYNTDGKLDFYISGMSSTTARRLENLNLGRNDKDMVRKMRPIMGYGSRMYLAQGKKFLQPMFRDQVARTGWTWGATSFDFDNDGDRDLYVANGHSTGKSTKDHCWHFWCHDIYTNDSKPDRARHELFNQVLSSYYDRSESWDGYQKNKLMMNLDGQGFINIAFLLGVAHEYDARAVVGDDLDGDGRVDLLVVEDRWRQGQILHVYRNRLKNKNNWIGVRLSTEKSQPSPQGAKITIFTKNGNQPGRIVSGDSIHAQHPTSIHFGLGQLTAVDAIEVQWNGPQRKTVRFENPPINRYHTIRAK